MAPTCSLRHLYRCDTNCRPRTHLRCYCWYHWNSCLATLNAAFVGLDSSLRSGSTWQHCCWNRIGHSRGAIILFVETITINREYSLHTHHISQLYSFLALCGLQNQTFLLSVLPLLIIQFKSVFAYSVNFANHGQI